MRAVSILIFLFGVVTHARGAGSLEVVEEASLADTNTSILGINHIGLSVKDLDKVLTFYLESTGFELIRREKVSRNRDADRLFGHRGMSYEVAVLKAPNMLFEIIEFAHNKNAKTGRMPAEGPGMTHTCFQSPSTDSGWDKFVAAGADPLSRGGQPIDLGGYGVTYGYAYDPEGNMMELEQLDGEILARAGYDPAWQDLGLSMWMSQVALATHDIDRLMSFYQEVLGIKPYRIAELHDNPRADEIADIDDMHIKGGWFRMNKTSKVMEFWQYINPVGPEFDGTRDVTDLGYSFSLEVGDIQQEYDRLSKLGVKFISKPVRLGSFWHVYAKDVDENVFSLRQSVDPRSALSVRQMDAG